jgi:hypothetical protein
MTISKRRLLRLAAPALILSSRTARAFHHGNELPPPPYFSQWGFNSVSFHDPFTSLNTIDVNNTQAPGFKWYTFFTWPNSTMSNFGNWQLTLRPTTPVQPANTVVLGANGVTLFGLGGDFPGNNNGGGLQSAVSASNAQGYIGNAINTTNGFGMRVIMQADPSQAFTDSLGWPFVGLFDLAFFTGASNVWCEIDGPETFPTATGSANYFNGLHDWNINASSLISSSNQLVSAAPPNALFTSDTLFVAPALNGGTGLLQRWFNGAALPGLTVSFSATGGASPAATPTNPNGVFNDAVGKNFMIYATSGGNNGTQNWPVTLREIIFWQLTGAG